MPPTGGGNRGEAVPDWEHPDTVAFFRARDPDVRLTEMIVSGAVRPPAPVLDLGCAAGRNAVFLAERGFPGVAVDASAAMVATTRDRLTPFAASTPWTVLHRSMTELDDLADASFGLVLALGVLQNAPDDATFARALDELVRVARPGARLLIQNFGPDSLPHGVPLRRVRGERHAWSGFDPDDATHAYTLPDMDALDGMLAERGCASVVPTRVAWKTMKAGRRTTIIGDYRKDPG
jgi:SAM-dependent methyltransferase